MTQYAIAVGWKHLYERLPSDRNKERKLLASRMKDVKTFGFPWETKLHLHGKWVFKVCLSLIISIFVNKHQERSREDDEINQPPPPERCDGEIPEAFQVSTRHFDVLLEQVNGYEAYIRTN
jgi:hypothetical protein